MTHVITIAGKHWPAWKRADGMMVDLRLFPRGTLFTTDDNLTFLPDDLRAVGLPENLIEQAGESEPKGFVLFS